MNKDINENETTSNTERIDRLLLTILRNISDAKSILGNSEAMKLLSDAEIACIEAKELNTSLLATLSQNSSASESFKLDTQRMKSLALKITGLKILLLEDEKPVAELIKGLLEKIGCKVRIFNHPDSLITEYINTFKSGTKYDVLILDLIISGEMSGAEVLQKLKKIDPDVCAILSSGYCDAVDNIIKKDFKEILPKPFTYAELIQSIARACGKI